MPPRERLRDQGLLERQRIQARILSDVGLGGRVKVGATGGGTQAAGLVAAAPGTVNAQTVIHHATLHATDGHTIAAGGAAVQWDRIAGAPTEVRGFPTLLDNLGDGAVGAIPLPLKGVYDLKLLGLYATYRDGGDITVTLTRNSSLRGIWTVEGGPLTSRFFHESILGQIEGDVDDLLTVTLPNGSGAGTVLNWAQLQLRGIGVAPPTTADQYLLRFGTAEGLTTGWRYNQVALTDSTDFSAKDYDDSAWSEGPADFGDAVAPAANTYATHWDVDTRLWVRRSDIPERRSYTVHVRHDDDATVWWNGTLVATLPGVVEGDGDEVSIPAAAIDAGLQTIAIRCDDLSGGASPSAAHLDVKIVGSN